MVQKFVEGQVFEKNKGNTKEGKQKKWTVIFGIILVVLCIALGPIYLI